jgi:glycosyltransferase involved in cell wall biosynthesis
MTLHYAGQPGQGYGWGTCNTHLRAELAKLVTINEGTANVVFMPLADHDLNPATPARGEVNLAYTFFEFELGPNAAAKAAKYDVVFAGSTWCLDRLAERGIHNTALLIQGVDEKQFSPQPKRQPDGQFRIFSGGKFEYRKGQDLVIAAFRELAKTHPEAHLVCSWFNPWPELVKQLVNKMGWDGPMVNQSALYHAVLCAEGLRPEQFTILPQLSHADLAREMANTDVGLFPNRCEGGTNLVLMEYAALGRPVIANVLTGHADVSEAIHYQIPATADPVTGWAEQRVKDIVDRMEMAKHYQHVPVPSLPYWPWSDAAEKIVTTARKYFARLN